MTALIQADRYGTSVGTSLRVMAEEGRETRMMEAEKKAAALPPKLTVPLIIFFLPVPFIVIIAPDPASASSPVTNCLDRRTADNGTGVSFCPSTLARTPLARIASNNGMFNRA